QRVPLAWLAAVVGLSVEAAATEAEPAIAAGVLAPSPGAPGELSFAHALIRETAYGSLNRVARARLHRDVATTLARRFPDVCARDPLTLARHAQGAGDADLATAQLLVAARRAIGASAFPEVDALTSRGLELIRRSADPAALGAREIELLTTRGLALISTKGYSSQEVEATYSRAVQLFDDLSRVPLHVLYGVWGVHLVRADARATARLVQLLEGRLADASHDEALVVHACLGVHSWFTVRLGDARRHFTACVDAFDEGDPAGHHRRLLGEYRFENALAGHYWLAWVDFVEGDVVGARRWIAKTRDLAARIDDPYMSCQVAVYLATLARELGDVPLAAELTLVASQLASEHELLFWRALAFCVEGWLAARAGAAGGADLVRMGLSILDASGAIVNRSYFQTVLVEVLTLAGQDVDAEAAADVGLAQDATSLGPLFQAELLRLRGVALDRSGRQAEAEDHLTAARSLARIQGMRVAALRAARDLRDHLARRGRRPDPEEELAREVERFPGGVEAARALLGDPAEPGAGTSLG
ncbi:MAG: hypothetical protein FJ104_09805, partial [Deltaproteobacteria bacterium]|nr:hypothetical protein [Deltaproteobacteria bacterium]